MDPEFAALTAVLPPLQFADAAAQRGSIRAQRARIDPPVLPPEVNVRERLIEPVDSPPVPVRTYSAGPSPVGLTIWLHGGGYCIGTLDQDESFCADMALQTGATVVSVGYRLAPEDRFPAALDDCTAVLAALADDHPTIPIVLAGASAGGGLAAALALRARDQNGPAVSGQVLLFPFLDATMSSASMSSLADAAVFDALDAAQCWEHYLGSERLDPPPYASPSTHRDLTGLPPAHVVAAGADCLRDEAVDYALRLQRAGVPTELHVVAGVPHGFTSLLPTAVASRRARDAVLSTLRQMLSPLTEGLVR